MGFEEKIIAQKVFIFKRYSLSMAIYRGYRRATDTVRRKVVITNGITPQQIETHLVGSVEKLLTGKPSMLALGARGNRVGVISPCSISKVLGCGEQKVALVIVKLFESPVMQKKLLEKGLRFAKEKNSFVIVPL